jgi:diguanylate cyclase (GGDEF)-like protein
VNELSARLRNGVRVSRLQERLRLAAITDGLTGLANYSEFREHLAREFTRTRRYGGDVSLLMIDIDHFKAVNDTHGHEVGNDILRLVARAMQRLVRETDFVARYGGEEFAVILPQTSLDDGARLGDRIRQTLAMSVRLSKIPELTITASVGVACLTDPRVHSVSDLINLADGALYVAKHGGRNRVIRADTLAEPTPAPGVRAEDVERLRKQVVSLSMQAKEMCLQTVWAFVQAIEARDPYAAHHSRNVTQYATDLAEAAGWSPLHRQALANAAMLHELGKIGVPDQLLRERGALSPGDNALIRQVPTLTCKILEPLRMFESEIIIIRYLRERWDGSGYPYGLAGSSIPMGARLLAVAETFDALTNDRPHRPSRSFDEAVAIIRGEAGRQFDPAFADLLARVAAERRKDWQSRIDIALRSLRAVAEAVEGRMG